jgi:ankyrin repeat protein
MTALMFAVKVGSLDVVKLLVEKSADLFAINSVSFTTSIILGYPGVFPY